MALKCVSYLVVFPLENNFDSKTKLLCKAKKYLFEAYFRQSDVASVTIKIATVESPRHPPPPKPVPPASHPHTKKKKLEQGTQARNKTPVEAVIVKTNSYKIVEKVPPNPHHFLMVHP